MAEERTLIDREEKILTKIIAAGGWLARAMFKYRDYLETLPASGNDALAAASLALRDAERMFKKYLEEKRNASFN